ncbi:MAG TPA: chemotaxis protein CheW [Myxococcota bacterium]|nr:chemotaxis protein CheW [Myxococcota bacterium]
MRCGTWTVGVDALSVRAIRPPRASDTPIDLGQLLRVDEAAPEMDAAKRRIVELGIDKSVTFGIDGALGTRALGLAEVQPLSRVLQSHGAPPWWIGTTQIDGELVLLLDLSVLASSQKSGA